MTGSIVAGMTISLDGFMADPEGGVGRLYTDFAELAGTPYMQKMIDRTGAVIMGRRMFDIGADDDWVGTYEFQTPIFVVTSAPPSRIPKQDENLTFTFVTDGVESAADQARRAAGEKDVTVVGGADVIGQLLRAGCVDELEVDVMPVLLGRGRRLFDDPALADVELEKIGVVDVGARTSLRFRVVHARATPS